MSRSDKHKEPKAALSVTPSAQKPEAEETPAGRLTRAQRTELVMREDAEEIVGELMDELLGRVLDGCYKAHLERQLVGFCASWAKTYITQVLQQQLLCVDEEPEELSQTEDAEPLPAIPDVWAQGCVPVIAGTPLSHSASQQDVDIVDADIFQVEAKQGPGVDQPAQTHSSPNPPEAETSPRRPVSNKDNKCFSPRTPAKAERQKKQQFAFIPKPLPGKLLPSLSCSAEDNIGPLEGKTKAQSDHNYKTGPFYQPKRQQPIPKLDIAALPRHCVLPLYEIVDKNCNKAKKPSGLSKLESKYNKQEVERTGPSLKPLPSSKDQPAEFQRRNEVSPKDMSPYSHRKEGMVSFESLRLDTMVLAKGVTLLDPKSAQMDPLILYPPKKSANLRPIRNAAALPRFSAAQITSGLPPQITPLFQPKS